MGDADYGWRVLARRRRHRILRDTNHSITIEAQQVLKKVDCWLQDYCLTNYGGEGGGFLSNTSVILFRIHSVMQSNENRFEVDVVLASCNKVSRDDENILDQINKKQMCSDIYIS